MSLKLAKVKSSLNESVPMLERRGFEPSVRFGYLIDTIRPRLLQISAQSLQRTNQKLFSGSIRQQGRSFSALVRPPAAGRKLLWWVFGNDR
jgi:hypothetical protein